MLDAGHPQEKPEKQSGGPDPVFVPSHCLPRAWLIVFCRDSQPSAWHHKYLLNAGERGEREEKKECGQFTDLLVIPDMLTMYGL